MALLLAAIGIYGLMSYSVEQRTQEIGIRVALGASGERHAAHGDPARSVCWRESVWPSDWPPPSALRACSRRLLFGVKANDPIAFGAVVITLAVVAWLAIYIPARRATRIDPLIALRYE